MVEPTVAASVGAFRCASVDAFPSAPFWAPRAPELCPVRSAEEVRRSPERIFGTGDGVDARLLGCSNLLLVREERDSVGEDPGDGSLPGLVTRTDEDDGLGRTCGGDLPRPIAALRACPTSRFVVRVPQGGSRRVCLFLRDEVFQ